MCDRSRISEDTLRSAAGGESHKSSQSLDFGLS